MVENALPIWASQGILNISKRMQNPCHLKTTNMTSSPWLLAVYDQYSFKLLPLIGKVVTNDEESYRYLAESIRMHPDQDTLKSMFEAAGFERTSYYNMTGGIVALHTGYKF